jgi:hypothetical protein
VEGGVLWHYPGRGLVVGLDATGHVALVAVTTAGGADVEGVRVGDPVRAAQNRWGPPTERGDGVLAFDRGSWVVIVSVAKDVIDGLAVRRTR